MIPLTQARSGISPESSRRRPQRDNWTFRTGSRETLEGTSDQSRPPCSNRAALE